MRAGTARTSPCQLRACPSELPSSRGSHPAAAAGPRRCASILRPLSPFPHLLELLLIAALVRMVFERQLAVRLQGTARGGQRRGTTGERDSQPASQPCAVAWQPAGGARLAAAGEQAPTQACAGSIDHSEGRPPPVVLDARSTRPPPPAACLPSSWSSRPRPAPPPGCRSSACCSRGRHLGGRQRHLHERGHDAESAAGGWAAATAAAQWRLRRLELAGLARFPGDSQLAGRPSAAGGVEQRCTACPTLAHQSHLGGPHLQSRPACPQRGSRPRRRTWFSGEPKPGRLGLQSVDAEWLGPGDGPAG